MPALPSLEDGPAQIAGWTDVGAVRLLLALEDHFKRTMPVDALHGARSVLDLANIVTRAHE
jgi:acyl carrier protein